MLQKKSKKSEAGEPERAAEAREARCSGEFLLTRKEGQSDGGMEELSGDSKEGQGIDKADTNGEDLAVVIDDDNEEE